MTTKDSLTSAPHPGSGEPQAFALNEHRPVWDAIPWVVAGTATAQERAQVEQHVSVCAHCRDELALQTQIHRGMQWPAPTASDDDAAATAGLAQLWAREDEAQAHAAGARGLASNDAPLASGANGSGGGTGVAGAAGAAGAGNGAAQRRSWTKRWLVMAVAAQAVAICVLGLRQPQAPQEFVTLSQPSALPPAAILRLVPDDRMDMEGLRQLLNQHSLRIVGADEHASSLLLAPMNPEATPASAAAALARHLRTEPGVMLVVPVGAGVAASASAP